MQVRKRGDSAVCNRVSPGHTMKALQRISSEEQLWQRGSYALAGASCGIGMQVSVIGRDAHQRQMEGPVKMLTDVEMIEQARTVLKPRKLSEDNTAGDVACALLSASGKLYLGVCIDVACGIGFCAEHSAIAAMITAGESSIAKIVAIWGEGAVLPPCGRCREFMYQIDRTNYDLTDVIMGLDRVVKLRDLLPHQFNEVG